MKQVLLCSPSVSNVLAQAKQAARGTRVLKSVVVIMLNEQMAFPVYCEADGDFGTGSSNSVDPDDLTDEAFWRWLRQQN